MKKFLSILLSVALILSCVSTTAFAAIADTDEEDIIFVDATLTDATLEEYILGDVNADLKISVVDAKWVLQNVAGERELDDDQTMAADVTLDGKVSVLDAKWILQVVAGLRELETPTVEDEPYVDPDGEEMQELADAIAEATATDATGYTQESVEALEEAIAEAEALLGRDDVTASEISQAIEDMQTAQKALETDTTELENAIKAAYTKDTTGYDINSVDEYYDAVAEAEKVLADKNVTPEDVSAAVSSLEEAVKNLKADKTELATAIESAEAEDTDGMTPETVEAFETALENAKAVYSDDSATAAQVASAIAALESAKAALVVDKTALNDKISEVEALDLNGYTAASVADVTAALNAAKTVAADENATPTDIATAKTALDTALAGLVIDTAAFDAAYATATAIDNNGYTSATANALTAAIADADAVKANADATVADYAAATTALENAVAGLKADMTAINASIAAANAQDTTGYTAASVTALTDALAAAQAMTENDLPADIAAAKTALDAALAGLVIDTAAFDAAYATATAIDNNGYTSATADALTAAIAQADAVKANADATVADYAAATTALENAVAGLKADMTAINASIAAANAKDTTGYTAASVTALTDALAAAQAMTENDLPADIATAKNTLDDALTGLKADMRAINASIEAAQAINTADYTAETVAVLTTALAAAQAMTENDLPADIETAKNALDAALAGLESLAADTTALVAKLAEANAYVLTDYTDDTAAVLSAAITAGQAVVDSTMPTTEQVTNAITELNNAIAGLVSLDDALAAKKAEALATSTTGMTSASVADLTAAIAQADTATTSAEKKAAIEAIDTAIAGLTVDKSALEAKIRAAQAADTTGMTADSVSALNTAITEAQAVDANADATVADVTAAASALDAALAGLTVDKSALEAKIEFAKAYDVSDCTDTSVATLNAKIAEAEAVLADDSATVAQVNAAIAGISNALRNLGDNLFDSGLDESHFAVIDWR